MSQLTDRQSQIISNVEWGKKYAIADLRFFKLSEEISLATFKRDLQDLIELQYLQMEGTGRNSVYSLTGFGLLHKPLSVDKYFIDENLRSKIISSYNFELFDILSEDKIFSEQEMKKLNEATKVFKEKGKGSSEALVKKELERFVIELSWKSSKIEGNTYTLLDTELLLKEGLKSNKNTDAETTMILNHKKTFLYILESIKKGINLQTFRELENIHRLLVENLGINHGLRRNAVGVTGTKYLPLTMGVQIEEETKNFIDLIAKQENFFVKGLLSILIISYLQAFEDGNKRTGRLFANAMLLSGGLAPLSYRDVDEKKYREAVLIFYEQNSLEAFKEIFIEQYIFSCNTYNLG